MCTHNRPDQLITDRDICPPPLWLFGRQQLMFSWTLEAAGTRVLTDGWWKKDVLSGSPLEAGVQKDRGHLKVAAGGATRVGRLRICRRALGPAVLMPVCPGFINLPTSIEISPPAKLTVRENLVGAHTPVLFITGTETACRAVRSKTALCETQRHSIATPPPPCAPATAPATWVEGLAYSEPPEQCCKNSESEGIKPDLNSKQTSQNVQQCKSHCYNNSHIVHKQSILITLLLPFVCTTINNISWEAFAKLRSEHVRVPSWMPAAGFSAE